MSGAGSYHGETASSRLAFPDPRPDDRPPSGGRPRMPASAASLAQVRICAGPRSPHLATPSASEASVVGVKRTPNRFEAGSRTTDESSDRGQSGSVHRIHALLVYLLIGRGGSVRSVPSPERLDLFAASSVAVRRARGRRSTPGGASRERRAAVASDGTTPARTRPDAGRRHGARTPPRDRLTDTNAGLSLQCPFLNPSRASRY